MSRRVVLAIVEAKCPRHAAGHRCATLGWLEAFRQLGWETWIVEDLASAACTDEAGRPCEPAASIQVAAWRDFVHRFGCASRETLFLDGAAPGGNRFHDFAHGADLFLNYSGQFHALGLVEGVATKAYLDVDPGYTQVWAADYGCDMNFDGHDAFVTVGATFDAPGHPIPTCGRTWLPTFPPASVSLFTPQPPAAAPRPWTTVAHWYAGSEIATGGLALHPKRANFERFIDLPGRLASPVAVACDLQPEWDDYRAFQARGWQFRDVGEVCATHESYVDFIRASAGELGIAKGGYVAAGTGWMSDRSMVYLASGRPVVAMDTGWAALVGEHPGLRAFTTPDEAVRAIELIEADYPAACASARRLAEDVFAGEKIVGALLDRLDVR